MSSFKNAAKSHQKTHRERSQLESRAHLGVLEKKKDYKQRAEDHHRKAASLRALKRKAQDKNPDEFYHGMISSRLEEGVHTKTVKAEEKTPAQIKLIHSQDLTYITYKRSTERKKIERLQSGLHLLDTDTRRNKHTVFLDSKKEVAEFDAAKHLDTHPEVLGRTYNRPRLDTLRGGAFLGTADHALLEEAARERGRQYTELDRRLEREQQLSVIAAKLEMKKLLQDSKAKKKKVCDETKTQAAIYKWVPQRKR